MKSTAQKLFLIALAGALLTAMFGCNSSDKDKDDDQPSDFAQKELEKHHENGEINDYQYQQSLRQFTPPDPNAQKPAAATDTSAPAPTPPVQP